MPSPCWGYLGGWHAGHQSMLEPDSQRTLGFSLEVSQSMEEVGSFISDKGPVCEVPMGWAWVVDSDIPVAQHTIGSMP